MIASRSFAVCSIAILTAIFVWRCHATYRVFNDTKDEAIHIASGLEIWQKGQYTFDRQHPPLARMLFGFSARLAGLRYNNPRALWLPGQVDFYWRTLAAARMGNLIFVPLLLWYVYVWGRQLYGPVPALVAAALTSLSPNLLAHASLATVDFGAAATGFIAAYYFWKWSRGPGLRSCLKAALAFGAAVLTKFSALVFLPAIAVIFFLIARRKETLRHTAAFLAFTAAVVWAGYLFQVGPLPPAFFFAPPGSFAQRVVSVVEIVAGHNPVPAPGFVRGVLGVLAKNAAGHPSYLLGEMRQFGWWHYFPVALAVKTTLPLLLLVLTSLALWALKAGKNKTGTLLTPLAAAGAVLLLSMTSALDLGIRYILIIYPLFALAAAGIFFAADSVRPPLRLLFVGWAAALGIWHMAESIIAHPDYLAYFNQIARGREEDFLLDSNLDWGQDLERLRRYLSDHNISSIYMSYFGFTDPAWLGVSVATPLLHGAPSGGWVAVSKNHIGGIDRHPSDFAWTKRVAPAARIGKSILLYHLPAPP